jgi:AcrR family transcriptional regulator
MPAFPGSGAYVTRVVASRDRLLKEGLAIARRTGLRSITVRGVAARARVNLGSFVYHFGSREAFVAELLEGWYGPLLSEMQLAVGLERPPLERLREMFLQFADWVRANSGFIAHLVMDAASGEAAARKFVASLDQRHPALLLQAIAAAQDAGELRRENPLHVLLFLMPTLALPALLFHGVGVGSLRPRDCARARPPLTGERAALEQRLGWALRGLSP